MTDKGQLLEPINDTWLSGKPYYCAVCGLGFGEFIACEEADCRLETVEQAQVRLAIHHGARASLLNNGKGEAI